MPNIDEQTAHSPTRRVIVLHGIRAEQEVAIEVAGIVGTAVRLIAAGSAVVVVPDGPTTAVTVWPRRMRPVLDVTRSDDASVDLDIFTRGGEPARGAREKIVAHVLPSLSLSWRPQDDAPSDDISDSDRQALLDDIVEALALRPESSSVLRRLLDDPGAPPSVHDLTAAFELPETARDLLSAEVDPDELTGVVRAERLGVWPAIRESLLARPEGTSVIARMRRWDYDRPALSVAAIAVAGVVSTLGWVLPVRRAHPLGHGWPRVITKTAATVLAIDAIGSLVIFVTVRRRLRLGR